MADKADIPNPATLPMPRCNISMELSSRLNSFSYQISRPDSSHSFDSSLCYPVSFNERVLSYGDFPKTLQLKPIQFAKSGFIYNNISKHFTCTGCNKVADISTFNPTDKPSDPWFHMEGCQFVKTHPVKSSPPLSDALQLQSGNNTESVQSNKESPIPCDSQFRPVFLRLPSMHEKFANFNSSEIFSDDNKVAENELSVKDEEVGETLLQYRGITPRIASPQRYHPFFPRTFPSPSLDVNGPVSAPTLPEYAPLTFSNLTWPVQQSAAEISNLKLELPCENPNNPSMREEHIRLQTFTNNPNFRRNTPLRASDTTLAQAGLYYLGDGDKCKCWFCGGGLMNFEEGDDPWFEHAKFYPNCEFLLQQRGPAWLTSVSIQNPNILRPNLPDQTLQVIPNVVTQPLAHPPEPHIDDPVQIHRLREKMLQAGMRSEPGQAARAIGFSDEKIKDMQRRYIAKNGCCYESSEALIDALLGYHQAADSAESLEGAVGGVENEIPMDIQMLRSIGPCSPINNSSHSTAHSSNPGNMMINGQSFDEIMANAVDNPFFGGEMYHLRNNAPAVHFPQPQTHMPYNNMRSSLPGTATNFQGGAFRVEERISSVHGESSRNQDSHGGLLHEFMDSDSSDSESTSISSGYGSSEESFKTMSNSKYRMQQQVEIPNHTNCSATSTTSLLTAQEPTTTTKASAEERLQELERERRCKICLTEEAVILFIPCGHICACVGCAERVKFCPVCRTAIDKSFRTFRA
uniref:E3 ubiquitin-protein ligase XIAP-like isoform X2 n=1 Tax=Styela clava TaxID=7725 RepID=UPI0019398B6E|nr:E3 ubiquitin-protein ligase XIAP-like isoform X2 [Styela clava]